MADEKHDRVIVEAFAQYLRAHGMPEVKVDRWLEDEYPGTSQVEAMVGPFAVEHTSIDTFPNQRRNGMWFAQVVEPIESVLSSVMPGRVRVYLPLDAIALGQDWSAIRLAVAEWIFRQATTLSDGVHEVMVPGTAFTMRVSKDSRGEPALVFWLEVPDDGSLSNRLRDQVVRKAAKLAPHSADGKTRVLLVESQDGLTMSRQAMFDALQRSFESIPEGVDQLWFVDGTPRLAPEFFDLTAALKTRKLVSAV